MRPDLTSLLNVATFWLVVKGLYLVAAGLYLAFALVVMSQVKQMTETIIGLSSGWVRIVGWIHFGLAVAALFLAIVVL